MVPQSVLLGTCCHSEMTHLGEKTRAGACVEYVGRFPGSVVLFQVLLESEGSPVTASFYSDLGAP